MKNILLLSLVLASSFFIRLVQINNFPPSLNWDEVSLGYNAYSLLKTGHDEWGMAFPTIFRAFGDYKLPGYVYFSVLNPFNIRLTSVIFGTILVFTTYFIFKHLTPRPSPQLWRGVGGEVVAALLVAVSPWTWFLSRIALEANVATSIFSVGLALYFSKLSPILTTLFLTLPVWVYNSYRIFVPLILFPLYLLKKQRISLVTAVVVLLPMFGQIIIGSGQARFKWVSILDSAAIGKIEYLRNNSNSAFKNILYNRYSYFVSNFSKNYLNHFNPKFLFLSGNTNFQFNIPNQGLIFLVFAPFFYWGIWDIFKNKNYFLISWLLLAPVASSLTKDSPHVLRSITFLPLPFILIARQLSKINSKFLTSIIYLLFLTSIFYYLSSIPNYAKNYSWSFQYGYRQLAEYVSTHESEYDEVLITKRYGEPHIFLLYYQKIHPKNYLNDLYLNRYFKSDWYWVDSYSKYRFLNDWEFLEKTKNLDPDKKYLLISSMPISATLLTDINFLDGKTAFYLYEK